MASGGAAGGHEAHRFDRDTAVSRVEGEDEDAGAGSVATALFDARIDPGWWIVAGPNGGYLAAILLRAMQEAVGDPGREPRSQTTYYTARPRPGPARLAVRIERQGRSMSTLSARLEQEGRLIALSLAALGGERRNEGPAFQDARLPEVPAPGAVALRVAEGPEAGTRLAFRERYEMRPVFDRAEPDPTGEAVTGGWVRLAGPRRGDALLITALADAWAPAIFQKLGRWEGGRGVPTVELTTHFRAPRAVARLGPEGWYLVRFRTRTARDGFLEEDGEIWSEDGVLLAQSRQLALLA